MTNKEKMGMAMIFLPPLAALGFGFWAFGWWALLAVSSGLLAVCYTFLAIKLWVD